jgi:hypothetical protein
MEAIQKSMKEMKMKVEESEIGIKIKKGTTEFVHEHEEEINKVKSKVEETKTKVEERIIANNTKKEKRDSCSVDNKDKKDGDAVESTSDVKEDRDDDPIRETDDGTKRPSIKKRVEELVSKVEPEILKVKSKVLGLVPLTTAATTTEPKLVTENEASTSKVEESAADVESVDDADTDAEQNIVSVELEEETAGEADLVESPSSETDKPSKMTDEPKEDGDWNDVLPPPDTEEEGEGEDEDEIFPLAPSSSIPDHYKSNSKDDSAATTKTDGTEEKSNEKHINKLKKSIEDIRLKIETTIKEVSDKDKVKKIINPLKMNLVVAKAKIIALKEGKSRSDDEEDNNNNNNNINKEENFVTIAENVTKNVVGNTRNALKKAASKVGLIDDDNDEKKTAVEDEDDKKDDNKNDEETKSKLPKVVGNVRDALKKTVSKVLISEDDKKKPAAAEDNNIDNNNKTDDSIPCDTTKRESDVNTNTADTDIADTVNESDVKDDDAEGDNESK